MLISFIDCIVLCPVKGNICLYGWGYDAPLSNNVLSAYQTDLATRNSSGHPQPPLSASSVGNHCKQGNQSSTFQHIKFSVIAFTSISASRHFLCFLSHNKMSYHILAQQSFPTTQTYEQRQSYLEFQIGGLLPQIQDFGCKVHGC